MINPHLEFARFVFSQPACVEAELRAVLPLEVVLKVDWSTLQREPDVTVEPALHASEGVLCFSARCRDAESVRFILVLKSRSTSEDRSVVRRMIRYMIEDLERWQEGCPQGTQPPAAFPVYVYFSESPWTVPLRPDGLLKLS